MTTVLVQHRVSDYTAWKAVYEGINDLLVESGVRRHEVKQLVEDPNMVVVSHEFDGIDDARRFVSEGRVKAEMSRAGLNPTYFQVLVLQDAA